MLITFITDKCMFAAGLSEVNFEIDELSSCINIYLLDRYYGKLLNFVGISEDDLLNYLSLHKDQVLIKEKI